MQTKILLLVGMIALSGCLAQAMSTAGPDELSQQGHVAHEDAPTAQDNTRNLLWFNFGGFGGGSSGRSCWSWWQKCDSQKCQCTTVVNNNNNNNNGRRLLNQGGRWGWYDHDSNTCVCDVTVNNNNNNNNNNSGK